MKLKKLGVLVLSSMIVALSGSTAFTTVSAASSEVAAPSETGSSVTIEADLSNSDYQETVEQLFNDPNVLEVTVIDPSLTNASDPTDSGEPTIVPRSYIRYEAAGPKKTAGTYTGSTVLAKAQGGPGITLGISQTKSVSNTFSCSLSVPVKSISSVVGFSVTGSTSITVSGSATVPSTYNNRKVKTMTLSAYPIYQKYTYSVTKVTSNKGLVLRQPNVGTGSAAKAIGCTFKRTYTYR